MSFIESSWNFATSYIEVLKNDLCLSKASGFFWKCEERIFLVTNWHVLSGRNSETGKPMNPQAAIPDVLKFSFLRKINVLENDFIEYQASTLTFSLSGAEGNLAWREHPVHGGAVDIGCVDITSILPADSAIRPVTELEGDADAQFYPGQDVFIIGYPLGLIDPNPIPVWKRGSVATDVTYCFSGLPKVYLDTASRSGMSGSIVLGRFLLFNNYKKKNGEMSDTIWAQRDQILGIYSGRIGAHEVEAQLGICWQKGLIDEVVKNGISPVGLLS